MIQVLILYFDVLCYRQSVDERNERNKQSLQNQIVSLRSKEEGLQRELSQQRNSIDRLRKQVLLSAYTNALTIHMLIASEPTEPTVAASLFTIFIVFSKHSVL